MHQTTHTHTHTLHCPFTHNYTFTHLHNYTIARRNHIHTHTAILHSATTVLQSSSIAPPSQNTYTQCTVHNEGWRLDPEMEVARATEAASRCVLVCFGVCWRVLACFVALCVSDAYSCVRALVCVGLVELEVRYALVISPPRQGRGSRVEGRGRCGGGRRPSWVGIGRGMCLCVLWIWCGVVVFACV